MFQPIFLHFLASFVNPYKYTLGVRFGVPHSQKIHGVVEWLDVVTVSSIAVLYLEILVSHVGSCPYIVGELISFGTRVGQHQVSAVPSFAALAVAVVSGSVHFRCSLVHRSFVGSLRSWYSHQVVEDFKFSVAGRARCKRRFPPDSLRCSCWMVKCLGCEVFSSWCCVLVPFWFLFNLMNFLWCWWLQMNLAVNRRSWRSVWTDRGFQKVIPNELMCTNWRLTDPYGDTLRNVSHSLTLTYT